MSIRSLKKFIVRKINAEIPQNLSYHGVHHTLDVLEACNNLIKRMKVNKSDAHLIRTAALLHDIGIMWTYINHEEYGIEYVKDLLPSWGYTGEDILAICNMIKATQIPQNPQNLLEMILCDADLDYLGTANFYTIGDTLFREFIEYKVVANEEDWDKLQVKFLTSHHYHTPYSKKHREPLKNKYMLEIIDKWSWYDEFGISRQNLKK